MKKATRIIAVLLPIVALLILLLAGREAAALVPAFAAWVAGLGTLGPLVFAVAYVLATVLLVPGSLLTLAAGALFGVWRGTLIVLLAASTGACAAFLIARYAARERVSARV